MRVIVKNLPPGERESEVKEHFSSISQPTDVRVLTNSRGDSRRLAFIGYKTDEIGRKSIIHYNRSYYKGCRILMEEADRATEREQEEDPEAKRQKTEESWRHRRDSPIDIEDMKEIVKMITQKKETWENTVEEERAAKTEEKLEDIIKQHREKQEQERREKVKETGEVFIQGIPYESTEEEIEEDFKKYGPVAEVYLKHKAREDTWGEGKSENHGYAIVKFIFPRDAEAILGKNLTFQGRKITVSPSKGRPKEEETGKNRTNKTNGEYNALFFNFSAVLGVAAKEKRTTKALILKDRGTGLGGRIALLESELVEKTKLFLKKEKICEECTCQKQPCTCMFTSKKSILLKNLPYNTTESEVRKFFKKYARLIFAPSKTIAVLEYANKSDAQDEFKKNNLSKIREHPIYIEFLKITKERYSAEISGTYLPYEEKSSKKETSEKRPETGCKIVIKNVPFQAGRSEISEIVEGIVGKSYKLRIPKKFDGTHRGFCFVEIEKQELAEAFIERCKHIHLYGRHLIVEKAKI